MIPNSFPNVPVHVVDLFSRSAEVVVDLTVDHAPHRLLTFLYTDFAYHDPVLQLNTKSALSVRSGDVFHLFDRNIVRKLGV